MDNAIGSRKLEPGWGFSRCNLPSLDGMEWNGIEFPYASRFG